MIIKKASSIDSEDVFRWRNDKDTRLMAKDSKKIDKGIHEKWFAERLADDNCHLYLGINNKKKIGIVRFDYDVKKKQSEVSINLNPEERGKKLSVLLLQKSILKYLEINKFSLISTIKKNNIASKKIFQKCNFSYIKSSKLYDYYCLEVN